MAIDRRALMRYGAAAMLATLLPRAGVGGQGIVGVVLASCCRRPDGSFGVVLVDGGGHIVGEIALDARGHDIAQNPVTGDLVAFARQPGEMAVVFSRKGNRSPEVLSPPENRRFFGHGVFSRDGRLLYATENDLDAGRGVLGVYDVAAGFRRIGELATGGIGPHEVVLLGDGRTLVVANGGYETLPATGRAPIDLAAMRPSLAFVDALSGALIACHELAADLRPLSIRHLAVDGHDRVWFGGQWEGAVAATPELIGVAAVDAGPMLVPWPAPQGVALKGYIGSMSVSRDGRTIAASAPRAGRVLLIDAESRSQRGVVELADGCGVAAVGEDRFAIASGFGRMVRCAGDGAIEGGCQLGGYAFDNHLRTLS